MCSRATTFPLRLASSFGRNQPSIARPCSIHNRPPPLLLRRTLSTTSSSVAEAKASPTTPTSNRPPTAVLLMNMGGPSTLDEVGDFLSRLFHDRELIPLPFQKRLAPLIARRRTPKIVDQYDQIGGGSPIRRWTEVQGQAMAQILDTIHPETAPHKAYTAFRYARPLTEEALDAMANDGVKQAIAFTQYPQYSCSTTGSNLNELFRQIRDRTQAGDTSVAQIDWSVIDRWPAHPGLIKAFTNRIRATLDSLPLSPQERDAVPIMFSAHSLPMSIVSDRGDPYPAEVAATVQAVMSQLGHRNPYRVTWQSQVGPSAWLGPQTSMTVQGWAKQGYKHALAVPIAFTQDHIETLFELDIELKEEAEHYGMQLHRVESLNDEPTFLRALAEIVASHLRGLPSSSASSTGMDKDQSSFQFPGGATGTEPWNQGRTSRQMQLRCPGCTNPVCSEQKAFFGQGTVQTGEDAFVHASTSATS